MREDTGHNQRVQHQNMLFPSPAICCRLFNTFQEEKLKIKSASENGLRLANCCRGPGGHVWWRARRFQVDMWGWAAWTLDGKPDIFYTWLEISTFMKRSSSSSSSSSGVRAQITVSFNKKPTRSMSEVLVYASDIWARCGSITLPQRYVFETHLKHLVGC